MYIISCKHDDWDRRNYYAVVIQKLEGELGIKKYYFEEIRGLVADYLEEYQDDPDVQNMSIEEIEEIMSKRDKEFWRSVRGEE